MVGTPDRAHTGAAGTRRSAGRNRTKRTLRARLRHGRDRRRVFRHLSCLFCLTKTQSLRSTSIRRVLPTLSADTAGAELPHELRIYVATAATWSSLRIQPNCGIAGAVGAGLVPTLSAPRRTT